MSKAHTMFFGNWVNITMQIEELDVFLKEVHSFIEKTNFQLDSGLVTELPSDYPLEDLKYHFESTQGEILRKSIIISLAILLESELDQFCEEFKTYKNLSVGHKDFRGDFLDRFKLYSNKITLLGFDFSQILWQDIIGLYEIRNSLIHNSGFISNFGKKTTIENFIKRYQSFIIDDVNRIQISQQACIDSLSIIKEFFNQITHLAFEQFPDNRESTDEIIDMPF